MGDKFLTNKKMSPIVVFHAVHREKRPNGIYPKGGLFQFAIFAARVC